MSSRKRIASLVILASASIVSAAIAGETLGLGKQISEADLALWDISVGPDGKGLP